MIHDWNWFPCQPLTACPSGERCIRTSRQNAVTSTAPTKTRMLVVRCTQPGHHLVDITASTGLPWQSCDTLKISQYVLLIRSWWDVTDTEQYKRGSASDDDPAIVACFLPSLFPPLGTKKYPHTHTLECSSPQRHEMRE